MKSSLIQVFLYQCFSDVYMFIVFCICEERKREIYKACDIQTIDVSATVSSSSYRSCNLNLQTLVQEAPLLNCNIAKVFVTVIKI